MQRPLRNALLLISLASLCLACPIAWAETGYLVLHVKDVHQHPVGGLKIGVEGDSGSAAFTDSEGKARIRLAEQTKVGSWIFLQIVKSPSGKDLAIVSPWDYRAQVPSFENESGNFVGVVVVRLDDREALLSGTVLKAAVQQINKANAPKSADKQAAPENPKANLEAVAKQFGLSPDDLDKAIKAWGAKTTDPYEAGLAALYERNYDKATTDLQDSLKQREAKLAADQAADQKAVADAAFFLGQSLYEQGKYKESAVAFGRCLQIRPDDATVINNKALSLEEAGDYAGAEPLYRESLTIREKTLPPNDPILAAGLNNLGELLDDKGDYVGAEPLMRRALAIDEQVLGSSHPDVGRDLSNLAVLLYEKGDYAGAEPLMRRALAIQEKALGPDHPTVAKALNNLAELLVDKGDYAGAEPLMRRSLAIREEALGPDHPSVATALNNLAALLDDKGDYAGAESLYRRALAIDEKALGPDHPGVATDLNNLAILLVAKSDYAAAEPLMRRAVAIDEKALGPDHPNTRLYKENLDRLLQKSAQAAAPKAKN
ncbi:MAG: tetratricopeptide repeat protein [Candidatus Korobacteraceae bacterium]